MFKIEPKSLAVETAARKAQSPPPRTQILTLGGGFCELLAANLAAGARICGIALTLLFALNAIQCLASTSAFSQITTTGYNSQSGTSNITCSEGGQAVDALATNSDTEYNSVDFGSTGAATVDVRVASAGAGGSIAIRMDSLTGTLIGCCGVPGTGGAQTWTTVSCSITPTSGVHNLYLIYLGGSGNLFNVEWFKFYAAGQTATVTYPAPIGEPASADYTVSVNGRTVFVYTDNRFDGQSSTKIEGRTVSPFSFGSFDFTGSAAVTVTCTNGALTKSQVYIRPLSSGVAPTVNGNSITFTLDHPCNLSIEPYGTKHALHLFANPLDTYIPDVTNANLIYFGPGYDYINPMTLSSGQTIYIAGGAMLETNKQSGAGVTGTTVDYGITFGWINPTIDANGASNIQVLGRGIVDGNHSIQTNQQLNTLFRAQNCTGVTVQGIVLRDAGGWTTWTGTSSGVTYDNVKSLGYWISDDGIDIVSCSTATVKNCFVHNADDSIIVKGWSAVNNNTFANNVVWSDVGGGYGCINELQAEVQNCTWINDTVIHGTGGWSPSQFGVIGINNDLGGNVHNITFQNITIEDVDWEDIGDGSEKAPINLSVSNSTGSHPNGSITNITFDNINVLNTASNPDIVLSPNVMGATGTISGITFKNVRIDGHRIMLASDSNFSNSGATGVTVTNTDLSPAATASATTTGTGYPASNMNDNNDGTPWQSGLHPTFPQYATLTWTNNRTIDGLTVSEMYGQGQGITNADIQYYNGSSWVTLITGQTFTWNSNTSTVEWRDVTFPYTVTTTALRLKINSANLTWGNCTIYEFYTYGSLLDPNSYYKVVNHHSALAMDDSNGSLASGNPMIQWTSTGGQNQLWKVVDAGDGYNKLMNELSGMVLDVAGASTTSGAAIVQTPDVGTQVADQEWGLTDAGSSCYVLTNLNSNCVLDVPGASTTAGTALDQATSAGGGATYQQWQFVPPTNLSLTATASATSSGTGFVPGGINDGTITTAWQSAASPTFPQYLTLSWGATSHTVNKITLANRWGQGQGITNVDVQYYNGTTWITAVAGVPLAYNTNDGTVEYRDINFPAFTATQFRLKVNSANLQWNALALYELQAWGV